MERLQQYICWAKRFEPLMTVEAESVLAQYYQIQRQSSVSEASRTTVRMLESLARLAQVIHCFCKLVYALRLAHAMLMLMKHRRS